MRKNPKKIHPVKCRKAAISPKAKLFNRVKFPSELRFDLTSKDWVVIATGRARRPEMFKRERRIEIKIPKKKCPFCNMETQEKPVLIYPNTLVIPNKFPAFLPLPSSSAKRSVARDETKSQRAKWEKKVAEAKPHLPPRLALLGSVIEGNLYQTMNAVGFCELVVTRDHKKSLALLPMENVKEVMDCYQERYLELQKKPFVNYVSIFHNHGAEAGASQPHPHSQIITTPLIDIDLQKALINSEKYFKQNQKCVYCQMNNWERKVKKRIIFENKDFLAICPFASKAAFEVIISPKKHLSYFERITEEEKWQLAESFKVTLNKLYKALNDPPYNFYLKTSPCDGVAEDSPHLPPRPASRGSAKDYPFYHWHFTILPKTGIWAGFEIGTRMEISTIEPEKAAEYLRRQ